jgi:hypothetical protein
MRLSTMLQLLSMVLAALPGAAQVVSPDKVEFNYPQPPREGKAGYFNVAETGNPRCGLVIPAVTLGSLRSQAARRICRNQFWHRISPRPARLTGWKYG